jgi:periplasmic protein TonB
MLKLMRRLKKEQLLGLLFVLVLHSAVFFELWSYRIIPTPAEAITLMVNVINPPPPDQPKPPKPEPPKPQAVELPKPQQLVVETPVVTPDKPLVYVPSPPPVDTVPPLPLQPVVLSDELSVACIESPPPDYPRLSVRMNEQGKVVLRVELGEDGSVANVEVKTSSGYKRLDAAALNAVKTWRCKPAMRNGVAVRATALQPFNFVMEGR